MTRLSRVEAVSFVVVRGAPYGLAARRAGVSISTAWRWVHADSPNPPQRRPTLTDFDKRKIRNAIDAGQHSLRKIAVAHSVHHSTVCAIRDTMVLGGHRSKAVRCRKCGAKILTQVCLECEISRIRSGSCQC